MISIRNSAISFAIILSVAFCSAVQAQNVWAVDDKGNITLNGQIFRIKGGSWFGLEGRHESPDDATNPNGAPMEMYIGNMFWNESGRTLEDDAVEIKNLGFNSIRLPVAPQTLDDNNPQGKSPNLKNAESVRIEGAFTALKQTIKALSDAGLYVMLDMHSCSNYIGWRAGRLDARPPYVDGNREQYNFTREEYSCSATGNPSTVSTVQAYDVTKWLADLQKLATLGTEIGVDNIMGIDIFNEPWDYSWAEWRSLIDQAYAAISAVNPNILIFAQGIGSSSGSQDGTPETTIPSPHGDLSLNPNWGENLHEAGWVPPSMPKSKLVYSPHTYGPSVFVQQMFADLTAQPECAGLDGEAFGDTKCNIVINQGILDRGWHEHFGYLRAKGYAIAIGEWGGNMDWPNKSELRHQTRFSYLTDKTTDQQWQNAFVDYMMREGIYDSFYWSINPESADTYGLYSSSYDPVSNKEGWGSWSGVDQRKMTLLEKLWNAPEVAFPGTAVDVKINLPVSFQLDVSANGNISYHLPKPEFVSFKLYNLNGSLAANVISEEQQAGNYTLNRSEISAKAGLYLAVFKAGNNVQSHKVYLTK